MSGEGRPLPTVALPCPHLEVLPPKPYRIVADEKAVDLIRPRLPLPFATAAPPPSPSLHGPGRRARPSVEPPLPGYQTQQDTRRREDDAARGAHFARPRGRGTASASCVVPTAAERREGVPVHRRRDAGVCLCCSRRCLLGLCRGVSFHCESWRVPLRSCCLFVRRRHPCFLFRVSRKTVVWSRHGGTVPGGQAASSPGCSLDLLPCTAVAEPVPCLLSIFQRL